MVDIQSAKAEIGRAERRKKKKNKEETME